MFIAIREHWYFADFVGDHFENKNDPECNFHHYQSIPHFKITLNINFHWNQRILEFCRFCWRPFLVRIFYQPYLIYMPSLVEIPSVVSDITEVKDFDICSRFPWQRRQFWKFQDLNAPLEMGIHLPVKFSKDRIISLWEFGRINWIRRRRRGIIIIIIIMRNGAKTRSPQNFAWGLNNDNKKRSKNN